MKKLLTFLFLIASCSMAWAGTQYYVDYINGNNSWSGTAPAFVSGTTGPWKTCANVASLGAGSDVAFHTDQVIYIADALTGCRTNFTGSAGDNVVINSYGGGVAPILDGSLPLSSWASVDGTVYSAATGSTYPNFVLTEDGTRLAQRLWNTNIATTKAGTTSNCTAGLPPSTTGDDCRTDAMVPGTWAQSTSDYTIYIYPSSGIPSAHAYRYAVKQNGIYTSNATATFQKISNISGRMFVNNFIMLGGGTVIPSGGDSDGNPHADSAIYNVTSTMTGGRGLAMIGNRDTITYSDCSDNGSEAIANNQGCLVIEGITAQTVAPVMAYNNVHNARNGSCAEINGTVNGLVYNNKFSGCGHLGLEIYGYSGAHSQNNLSWGNTYDSAGAITPDPWRAAIRSGNLAYGNMSFNEIVKGTWYIGLHAGNQGYGTLYYNNTQSFTSALTTAGGGAMVTDNGSTGTIFKNNLNNIPLGGYAIYTANTTTARFDRNLNYTPSGTPYRYNGTDYATFALYSAAYKTATGLVDTSIYGSDPLLAVDYSLYSNSPAIDVGVDLSLYFATDYLGNQRPSPNRTNSWDIGAFEFQYPFVGPTTAPFILIKGGTIGGGRIK